MRQPGRRAFGEALLVDGPTYRALTTIGALIEAGKFFLSVDRTFPLAEIAEAHQASETGRVRGRLVVIP